MSNPYVVPPSPTQVAHVVHTAFTGPGSGLEMVLGIGLALCVIGLVTLWLARPGASWLDER